MKKILLLFLMGQLMVVPVMLSTEEIFIQRGSFKSVKEGCFVVGVVNGFMMQAFTDDIRDPAIGSLLISYVVSPLSYSESVKRSFAPRDYRDNTIATALGLVVGSWLGKSVRHSWNGLRSMAETWYKRLGDADEDGKGFLPKVSGCQEN